MIHAKRTQADGTIIETMWIDTRKNTGKKKERTPEMRQLAEIETGLETGNAAKGATTAERRTLLEGSEDDRDHPAIEHRDMKRRTKKTIEGPEEETIKTAKTADTDTDRIRKHVHCPDHHRRAPKDTTDEANIGTEVFLREMIQEVQGESGIPTRIHRALNVE